jgi:hypothetical protein
MAPNYADFFQTKSDHWMMEPMNRHVLLGKITRAINNFGGQFDVDYETHLYIA